MISPFTLQINDLTKLGQDRAVDFFRRFLWAEASRVAIGRHLIDVPQCVNIGDGGLDATIADAKPLLDEVIPQGTSGFQIKSGDMAPSECKKELHQEGNLKKPIKPEIKRLLDKKGTYVLVLFADIVGQKKARREDAVKSELRNLGYRRAKVRLYTANQLAGFVERYPALVAWFKNDLSQSLPYSSWAERHDVKVPKAFVCDQDRTSWIETTQRLLRERNYNCLIFRVIGLSGIGKTRLVFETLSADDLRNLVVYVHADPFRLSTLYNTLQNDENLNAIVVIDECDSQKHEEFVRAFASRSSRLAVLTLSDEIRSTSPPSSSFSVKPLGKSEIETILRAETPILPANVITRVAEFADGYPRIATLLAESYQTISGSQEEFFTISDEALMNRLIAGRADVGSEYFRKTKRVLSGLSVFRNVGFTTDVSKEAKWLASKMEVRWIDFCEIVNEQKQRGVIRGEFYVYVTPFMLRIHLLREWWEIQGATKEGFFEFFKDIPDDFRYDLLLRFSDQIPYMNATQSGLEFAQSLLGEQGIFIDGTAFKTNLGANFFLRLTEAAPESALECLKRTVARWTKEELMQFTDGRREIVWALERIAMWRHLFADAARILLSLGEAENETFSNNASGVFVQLFSPAPASVAPTEASPEERFSVLLEAIESPFKVKRAIALRAYDQALESQHFVRSAGAEHQGLRKEPQLWKPKTYGEWWDAYRRVWTDLSRRMDSFEDDERRIAIDVLLKNSRGLIQNQHLASMVLSTLEELAGQAFSDKKALLGKLVQIIHYEGTKLPTETRERLERLRDRLTGTDFSALLKRYAGMNLLEDDFDEENRRRDIRKARLEVVAKQSMENQELLRGELEWLVTNQAENGFAFGYELGRKDKGFDLLSMLLDAQESAGENASVYFLGGYFRALYQADRQKWEECLDNIGNSKKLATFLPELTWRSGPLTERAALRVLNLAINGTIQFTAFRLFAYGSVINELPEETVRKWLHFLLECNNRVAASICLNLIDYYYLDEKSKHRLPADTTARALTHDALFHKAEEIHSDQMDEYHWTEVGKAFVDRYPRMSLPLAAKILQHFGEDGTIIGGFHSTTQVVLSEIAKKMPDEVWKLVTKFLGPPIDSRAFRLCLWLRGESFFAEGEGALSFMPRQRIWEWVKEDIETRAWYVAHFVPKSMSLDKWQKSLARDVLVHYGDREDVRRELRANFSSGSWSGPASEHYQDRKQFLIELKKIETNVKVRRWIDECLSLVTEEIRLARIEEEKRGF